VSRPLDIEISDLAKAQVRTAEEWWRLNRPKAPNAIREELPVFAVPGHTQGSAAYLVDDVLFMGDAADATNDGVVIGSPWVFSDSQPQDRASLVALDERLTRDNVPVKVIAFAHSGLLANGRAPLDAYAASSK